MQQKGIVCFLIVFCFAVKVSAQKTDGETQRLIIEARVTDAKTGQPLDYANVYNYSNGKGTITNAGGYFQMAVSGFSDSIIISFVGYNKFKLTLNENVFSYEVKMEESAQLLSEFTFSADEYDWIFDLLIKCRKNFTWSEKKAKTYFELKSFVDSSQVELLEAYYNGRMTGCDLEDLSIKNGRIGLRLWKDRFFVSLESSRAIVMLKLFQENEFFPKSPLELQKKEAKKNFYLYLNKRYVDEENDSVFVVDYVPRDTSGRSFRGQIWINKSRNTVLKMTYLAEHAHPHPFLPVGHNEEIENVDFEITRTFQRVKAEMFFKHIDFVYKIRYKRTDGHRTDVKTQAVLYAYNLETPFEMPHFEYADQDMGDYKKINAVPYNDYFWLHYDEFRWSDHKKENQNFMINPRTITNQKLFSKNQFMKYGLVQYPYIQWTGKRVIVNEFKKNYTSYRKTGALNPTFHISIKIYFDVDYYSDGAHFILATIFDPYETFYNFEVTKLDLCFINMLFDLCEMEKRNFENEIIKSDKQPETIQRLLKEAQISLHNTQQKFIRTAERGRNKQAMNDYNEKIKAALDIDNLDIFKPYEE